VFSGIQKLNTHYVPETFKWIGHSLDFLLSERQVEKAYKFSYAMPYIELTLGIGLLYKPARYIVLPLVIIMHVFNIILLVFITKDTNYMFLPWNIIMIALVLLLFANVEQERFFDISILFKGTNFYIVITLMLIFPFFSLRNQYDSFLSNAVSSSNLNSCEILLSHKAYQKLPYYIRSFTTNRKNEYILNVEEWAKHELKSPCVPEYRIFKKVRRYLIQLTQTNSQEIKFKFIERERIMP